MNFSVKFEEHVDRKPVLVLGGESAVEFCEFEEQAGSYNQSCSQVDIPNQGFALCVKSEPEPVYSGLSGERGIKAELLMGNLSASEIDEQQGSSKQKPFQCSFCGKGFTEKSKLSLHKRIHTGEKPFQCSFCIKGFTQKSNLTRHKRFHTGEKRFQCSFCDKRFVTKNDLSRHECTHTGEKPFQCSLCDQRFSQKSCLTTHERSHTGEKPFQCSYCDKGFSVKSNLIVHERLHTGEKPFQCSFCGKGFVSKGDLSRHERTHIHTVTFVTFGGELPILIGQTNVIDSSTPR